MMGRGLSGAGCNSLSQIEVNVVRTAFNSFDGSRHYIRFSWQPDSAHMGLCLYVDSTLVAVLSNGFVG